jgi:hypothetical protein
MELKVSIVHKCRFQFAGGLAGQGGELSLLAMILVYGISDLRNIVRARVIAGRWRKIIKGEQRHAGNCRTEAGRQRIDRDSVLPPASGQRAGEINHRALARVVRDHLRLADMTTQSRDRRHVDDAAVFAGIIERLATGWLNRNSERMLRFVTLSQASTGWSSDRVPQFAPALLI